MDLRIYFKEMLHELETEKQNVQLVPAPEQKHTGHMVRMAMGKNPDWYSSLCHENMSEGKGRRKPYSKIVRKSLMIIWKKKH